MWVQGVPDAAVTSFTMRPSTSPLPERTRANESAVSVGDCTLQRATNLLLPRFLVRGGACEPTTGTPATTINHDTVSTDNREASCE